MARLGFRKFDSYVSVETALAKLAQFIKKFQSKTEFVQLDHAYGRVLAKDIFADTKIPKYDASHMDGFAVKASDIVHASETRPARLKVTEYIEPERFRRPSLKQGEACMISTGRPLPYGADTIVPQEQAEFIDEENAAMIKFPLAKGSFVYHAGSDIQKGERLLARGNPLRAQDIGALASLRILKVPVIAKPRVSIIPTGSELEDNLESVEPGKVPNTHSHVIAKLVEAAGGIVLDQGATADSVEILKEKMRKALDSTDMILTIGGSSVGKYDLVGTAINSLGKPGVFVHGIKLDRGRVTGLAAIGGKPIIMLPGPIQGAVNAFIVFAYPAIRTMAGYSRICRIPRVSSILSKPWQARKRFPYFTKIVYVRLSRKEHEDDASNSSTSLLAEPLHGETESIMVLIKADGYAMVPEETTAIPSGQIMDIYVMPGLSHINPI